MAKKIPVPSIFSDNPYQSPAGYIEFPGSFDSKGRVVQIGMPNPDNLNKGSMPASLYKYPNILSSIKCERVVDNLVNKYTIELRYRPDIEDKYDPDYIDRLIASCAGTTENKNVIHISYGDASDSFNTSKHDPYVSLARRKAAIVESYTMEFDSDFTTMIYKIKATSCNQSYLNSKSFEDFLKKTYGNDRAETIKSYSFSASPKTIDVTETNSAVSPASETIGTKAAIIISEATGFGMAIDSLTRLFGAKTSVGSYLCDAATRTMVKKIETDYNNSVQKVVDAYSNLKIYEVVREYSVDDRDYNPSLTLKGKLTTGISIALLIRYLYESDSNCVWKDIYKGGIYIDGIPVTDYNQSNYPDELIDADITVDEVNSVSPDDSDKGLLYLISLMRPKGTTSAESSNDIAVSRYTYTVEDYLDKDGVVSTKLHINSVLLYTGKSNELDYKDRDLEEIAIGTPDSPVMSFKLTNDLSFGLISPIEGNYSNVISQYFYRDGTQVKVDTAKITNSGNKAEVVKSINWIKSLSDLNVGLDLVTLPVVEEVPIMSKIKVGLYVNGVQHFLSGIYAFLAITDTISVTGYTSSVKLIKIKSAISLDDETRKYLGLGIDSVVQDVPTSQS